MERDLEESTSNQQGEIKKSSPTDPDPESSRERDHLFPYRTELKDSPLNSTLYQSGHGNNDSTETVTQQKVDKQINHPFPESKIDTSSSEINN